MADLDDYLNALKQPLAVFIKDNFHDFKSAAEKDLKDFLVQAKDNIAKWTGLLASRTINAREFDSLLKGESSLGRLHALKQVGLAQTRWDLFTAGVITILVNTAIAVFL
ncbi:hypothetical protein KC131_20540 [Pseudomonas sp. JQ170]|uniref:hypothetical protein n=1 Tax=unclassified Pseudomonas TaxID=196821 RepID=UPI002653BBA9|nr:MULTISPECIES: hypothetical protein [unclassified Pseudomonas]MDN7143046.1 hypothetical protein [Pseudomonas sp. JQ170]WRO74459.1 hypothetical protein U9R80_18290 [Pseudomonas sp. 170C]